MNKNMVVSKDTPKTATKEFKSCTLQNNTGRRAYVSKLATNKLTWEIILFLAAHDAGLV